MKNKSIEDIKEELEEKKSRLKYLEDGENTDEYDDLLNCDGDVNVAGLSFRPSDILKEMDPTAYRCGLNDYNDSEITELTDDIESLEEELKEAESEEKEEEGE